MTRRLPHQVSVVVTGKVRLAPDAADPSGQIYVYQRRPKGTGNIATLGRHDLQLRRHVPQVQPDTDAQLRSRRRIAAATAAWQRTDPAERAVWKDRARDQRITGYNLFVRVFCRQHPLSEY